MLDRRQPFLWLCLAVALVPFGCGDGDDEAPPLNAAGEPTLEALAEPVEALSEAIASRHDGVVIQAGPHPVEVVAHPDGNVEAYFVGPAAPEPGHATVSVRVPTAEGPRPVMLIWDPEQAAYRGMVRGVTVAPGPVAVNVVTGGQRYRGRAPQIIIVGSPEPTTVVVEAETPPPATVVVERPAPPSAQVIVERPAPPSGPVVVVEHPRPRPVVVVEHPRPHPRPVVVVEHPRPRPGRVVVQHPGRRRGHGPRGRGHRGRGRRH